MRFGVLGPLEVFTQAGEPVAIPGLKVRALLAALLVQEGQPTSVDRLVDDIWGADPPGNPLAALHAKVSRLRRALDTAEPGARQLIVLRPSGYLIDVAPGAIDLGRFTSLIRRATATDDLRTRIALLSDALALWRGPALADFADAPFAATVIARLQELHLVALEERADARLALGEHQQLVGELGDLARRHPLRERLRAVHMRALYRAGRQSEALASYADLRAALNEELGLDPGPELVALHEAILRQDRGLDVVRPEPPARQRSNLPAPISDLVGRAEAVAEVRGLLSTNRLVTLVGSGGVGKTRLALEIAYRLADGFPDGAWLVELAAFGRSGQRDGGRSLTAATMAVLGIREDGIAGLLPAGPPLAVDDRLAGALGSKNLLLVLDNCEHLVEEVAHLVELLLRAAPGLRVLATSQAPLEVAGEILWKVAPLELPDPGAGADPVALMRSSAVQLFVARAAATTPGFALNPANTKAVAVLCKRLDGIPLALELAATRVRALGVHELVARLDDRFRLLATGHRGAPPRQQTLRSMIDWSWGLLASAERILLRRLAVHADSSTLEAVEEICAGDGVPHQDVFDLLARLVDRSLVVVVDTGEGVRYRLLESVAAYCTERLRQANEHDRVEERFQLYYLELAERAESHLYGHAQRHWLERLDQESTNLRHAFDSMLRTGRTVRAVRLANALSWYWFLRGRVQEAQRVLTGALRLDGEPSTHRARAITWQAGFGLLCGRAADRAAHSRAALGCFDRVHDPHGLARARWFLGLALYITGDLVTSEELVNQAYDGFAATGDQWGLAAALSERAKQALVRGDLAALRRDGMRSAELYRDLGDRWGQLQTVYPLAALAEINGDYRQATRLHHDGLRIAEELGLWTEASDRLSGLGRIALLTGAFDRAEELHQRALWLSAEQGFKPGEMYARIGLALGARRAGKLDIAEDHLREVLEWNRQVDFEPGNTLILAELGFVAEQRGDWAGARELHRAGFVAARHVGDPRALALALEGLAGAESLAGDQVTAARLLGAAAAARESTGVPLPPAERGDVDRIMAVVEATLTPDALTAAVAHGRTLTPDQAAALAGGRPTGADPAGGNPAADRPADPAGG